MAPPMYYDSHNYYDSQDMVLPNHGYHDCANLYPLYILICKHWIRTLANCNICYAFLLIISCYEEEKIY